MLYSLLLIIPILAERELGLGPSGAGLLIGAMTGAMMVASPIGGHLSDRLGRRTPVLIGSAIAVVATVGLVLIAGDPGIAGTAALVALAGVGVGLAGASLQTTAVESAPAAMVGVASGVFMTVRYTGGIAAAGLGGCGGLVGRVPDRLRGAGRGGRGVDPQRGRAVRAPGVPRGGRRAGVTRRDDLRRPLATSGDLEGFLRVDHPQALDDPEATARSPGRCTCSSGRGAGRAPSRPGRPAPR